jgi:hypothetical protein
MSKPIVSVPTDGSKWYRLTVTYWDGTTEQVSFPDEGDYETLGSPYLDHAPNPRHVWRWAERMGYDVDDASLEAITGRWVLDYTDGAFLQRKGGIAP